MRAQEFVTDEINKQVFSPGWTDETTILNRYVLKARAADDWNKYQKLDIDVFDPEGEIPFRIAYARFRIKPGFFFQKNLEASMIYVSQEYQKRGIATAIYQYVRKLGNTIKPSRFQLPAGKSMWKSFDRTDALAEEFDGPTAAGCIVVAEDTGRWCLQQRSNTVSDPGVWSTWGGGREPGENLQQCVRRELAEESGYIGPVALRLVDSSPSYATFMAVVPHEFEPRINSECQDWQWSDPDDLPDPLHPGLLQTLSKNFETFNNVVSKQGVAEGSEQQYLWHGSRQKIPMLEPRQSVDTGGAAGSNQNAIYATSDPKVAIAMGLTTPGSDTGMFPNDPQMVLFSGKIRKGENVYLHKLPMNGPDGKPQFVQGGNSREFHSVPGVKGIKPAEIKAVPVDKYLNLIRQATPQDLELRKKYMKQGVAENFADGKVKGKSRPGRVKRAGASCNGSVTDLRARAKKASGERAKMYHWCANMKSGKKKNK